MKTVPLYTGNGVSLSPLFDEGRKMSSYVRLIADDGKMITDGKMTTMCADVLSINAGMWTDCEAVDIADDM